VSNSDQTLFLIIRYKRTAAIYVLLAPQWKGGAVPVLRIVPRCCVLHECSTRISSAVSKLSNRASRPPHTRGLVLAECRSPKVSPARRCQEGIYPSESNVLAPGGGVNMHPLCHPPSLTHANKDPPLKSAHPPSTPPHSSLGKGDPPRPEGSVPA
jgi:hypothetical protein